jgi:2-(1,2-epoxy-1,2-dihydrophenyl)acetyl-CoA isomerase
MTYESILYQSADGIARITLNRPDRLNSFTSAMHGELRDALRAGRQRPQRARAAADLAPDAAFARPGPVRSRRSRRAMPPWTSASRSRTITGRWCWHCVILPLPVVCAVNGVAAGAGANIALACDIVVATQSASFIQAVCKIGLIPDSAARISCRGSSARRARWGSPCWATSFPAQQAAEWGLIWKCVDDAAFASHVDALLAQLAEAPTRGLAAIKRALHASQSATLEAQLDPRARRTTRARLQRRLSRRCRGIHREASAAFHRRVTGASQWRIHCRGRRKSASSAPARWAPASLKSQRRQDIVSTSSTRGWALPIRRRQKLAKALVGACGKRQNRARRRRCGDRRASFQCTRWATS